MSRATQKRIALLLFGVLMTLVVMCALYTCFMTATPQNTESQHHSTPSNPHFENTSILGLLDWEQRSLDGILKLNATYEDATQSCVPPLGVTDVCCLGSYSGHRETCSDSFRYGWTQLVNDTVHYVNSYNNDMVVNLTEVPVAMACDLRYLLDCKSRSTEQPYHIGFVGDSVEMQIF